MNWWCLHLQTMCFSSIRSVYLSKLDKLYCFLDFLNFKLKHKYFCNPILLWTLKSDWKFWYCGFQKPEVENNNFGFEMLNQAFYIGYLVLNQNAELFLCTLKLSKWFFFRKALSFLYEHSTNVHCTHCNLMIFQWTRETKFPHAVWAAGRGLIALLLPNFDIVDNLWLEPLSWQVSHFHIFLWFCATTYSIYNDSPISKPMDTF